LIALLATKATEQLFTTKHQKKDVPKLPTMVVFW